MTVSRYSNAGWSRWRLKVKVTNLVVGFLDLRFAGASGDSENLCIYELENRRIKGEIVATYRIGRFLRPYRALRKNISDLIKWRG